MAAYSLAVLTHRKDNGFMRVRVPQRPIISLNNQIAIAALLAVTSPSSEWQTYEATAYSHGCVMPRSGKEFKKPQRGANNKWPIPHVTVAADPGLPFGTKILLSHRGVVTETIVGDRGHAIKGKRLDLFMKTCEQAKRFGRKKISVRIVK